MHKRLFATALASAGAIGLAGCSGEAAPDFAAACTAQGDLDTATPIGNVVVLSVDDESNPGEASAIAPYLVQPDADPPQVEWSVPADDAQMIRLNRRLTLGRLLLPMRRATITDQWSPREIAVFEAALCIYGKEFHTVRKLVAQCGGGKTTRQVVEFYYLWKKSSHYRDWKGAGRTKKRDQPEENAQST